MLDHCSLYPREGSTFSGEQITEANGDMWGDKGSEGAGRLLGEVEILVDPQGAWCFYNHRCFRRQRLWLPLPSKRSSLDFGVLAT